MKTKRSLGPDDVLLVGRLTLHPGLRHTPPSLGIKVWCPACKRHHFHGYGDEPPARSDAVEHRVAHCAPPGAFDGRGYWIALDPDARDENNRILQTYKAALALWQAPRRPTVAAVPAEAAS